MVEDRFGGGVEHFLTPAWSVKAEYLHFDFGTQHGAQTSISDPPVGYVYTNSFKVTADTAKVGVKSTYHIVSLRLRAFEITRPHPAA